MGNPSGTPPNHQSRPPIGGKLKKGKCLRRPPFFCGVICILRHMFKRASFQSQPLPLVFVFSWLFEKASDQHGTSLSITAPFLGSISIGSRG